MKRTKVLALVLALFFIITAVPGKALNVRADETGEKIRDARNGVMLVVVGVRQNGETNVTPLSIGSGFLIGSVDTKQYIVTNYHVVDIDEYKKAYAKDNNIPVKNLKTVMSAVVTSTGSSTSELEFNPSYASANNDLAVLEVKDKIYTSKSLTLSDDGNIQEADSVWALGYPYDKTFYHNDVPTYKNEDVDMQHGTVTKFVSLKGVKCIEHDATLAEGSSGGPLVDENGYVVGVNAYGFGDGNTYESIRINYVKDILDTFGIQYDKVGEDPVAPVAETEANAEKDTAVEATTEEPAPSVDKSSLETAITDAQEIKADDYSKESYDNYSSKLSEANAVMDNEAASQQEVDDALNSLKLARDGLKEKSNSMIYIVIGAVAVVLLVILGVILLTRKKKPADTAERRPTPMLQPNPQPVPQPAQIPQPGPPAGGFYGDGAGETSVLNEGAGETTLLSNQNMIQAYLFRESNSENIKINKSIFAIGRERKKVDYCVSDNNSVGRNHAEIILKNNTFYLIDQKSTNGTYLNGVKVSPLQEMELKNGDKIRLSDEEFVFKMI